MSGKLKLVSNSLSVLINRLGQSITAFILTAAIARMLGAKELGQYLLAFSYYFIFMMLASQGLKILLTRDLAKRAEDTQFYFTNGIALQFLLSLASYLMLVATVTIFPYHADTTRLCYIYGLAVIPFSLSNVTEAIFQAQERMHLIAVSTVPIYILRLLVIIQVMQKWQSINLVAAVLVLSEFLILFIELGLIRRQFQFDWKIDFKLLLKMLQDAKTFFAIEGISIVGERLEILALSLVSTEAFVGVFGGINQLMQPITIMSESINLAIFPSLSKVSEEGKEKQRSLTEGIGDVMCCLVVPFVLGIFYFGDDLMGFVFGNDPIFLQSDTPLNIVAISLIPFGVVRPLFYVLMASGLERINLKMTSIISIVNAISVALLVSQFQVLGAAINVLFIRTLDLVLAAYYTREILFSMRFWRVAGRSLVFGGLMLVVFEYLRRNRPESFLLVLGVSTAAYLLIAGLLAVLSAPGRAYLRRKLVGL
jgi:O-antigen/teichoic acid export membrane protein